MATLKSLIARCFSGRAPQEPFISVVPSALNTRRVVPEYQTLYAYLDHQHSSTVVLTFVDLESLLGHPLPPVARRELGWWTDTATRSARQAEAWTTAGRSAQPNFAARTVAFERHR